MKTTISIVATASLLGTLLLSSVAVFSPNVTSPYDEEEQIQIIALLNKIRGEVTPEPVAKLTPLAWSDAIAAIAQDTAETCAFNFGHSDMQNDELGPDRKLSRSRRMGQTTFQGTVGKTDWNDAINSWDAEKADFDICTSYKNVAKAIDYQQVVWADTTHVGCGFKNCGNNFNFVCNFYPGKWSSGMEPYAISGAHKIALCGKRRQKREGEDTPAVDTAPDDAGDKPSPDDAGDKPSPDDADGEGEEEEEENQVWKIVVPTIGGVLIAASITSIILVFLLL